MVANAFRMTKSVAKLLLRNKAFWVVGVVVPLMATLLTNIWTNMSKVEKSTDVIEVATMDEQIAYLVDFYRFPVKVYDTVNNDWSREICEQLNNAGLFQIMHVDVTGEKDSDIDASVKKTALEDKAGAILVLRENPEDVEAYSVGEDKRFDLLCETLSFVLVNELPTVDDSVLTLYDVASDDEVDYYATREFSYCLAIACIAFTFGGVIVLGTVISEKQDNVFARILLTKATKGSYLLSKLILSVGISLIQAIVMAIAFTLFVKADIGITSLQFFVIVLLEGLVFNLISLCGGLFFNSIAAASFLSFAIWSVSALLAGTYFDISSASDLYKKVAMVMPERWAMLAVNRFQAGSNSGYTIMLCATAAFMAIIFVVGVLGLKLSNEE